MANGINGSFSILQINGKYLFIKRVTDGLWDIPGGGYNIDEIDYKAVAAREMQEEIGINCLKDDLRLCAILGQRLKAPDSLIYGGVTHGYIFLHYLILYSIPKIKLSNEHTNYRLFDYQEIIKNFREFKSGPLWLFFTFLEFQRTNIVQEGLLFNRRIWQGKKYL